MKLVWVLLLGASINAAEVEGKIEACSQGNIQSCYDAGMVFTTGENAKDQEKKDLGMQYLRKACKYGENRGCDALGDNYYKNKSYHAAKPYLETSCERGIKDACEAMGTIYRDGHETRQDDVKAREYYEKACELGSKDSCINVAIIYRGGFGIEKNREMEKSYYQKACDHGSKVGCERYTKMDNEDKGIAEPGILDRLKSLFN
ncbi:MAG TPA: tetratricopeptide repeat protein [Sulfurovum sp.]|nr:tetratricopeptide repeat protein [Sulfurovum sp.]